MGRIEADIALLSWLFGLQPCSGQGQFTLPTGFFIMNVTFKQVIKRAKRIVCTLILCSTCCKLFRVYTGGKSFTIRQVFFVWKWNVYTIKRCDFSHFLMMMQEAVWLVLEFGAFLGLTEVRRKCGINLFTKNTYLSKLTFQRQVMRFNRSLNPHFERQISDL